MLDKETLKNITPLTLLIWIAYTICVVIVNFYNPKIFFPLTNWRLLPLITLILLVSTLALIARDLTVFVRKEKAAKQEKNERIEPEQK